MRDILVAWTSPLQTRRAAPRRVRCKRAQTNPLGLEYHNKPLLSLDVHINGRRRGRHLGADLRRRRADRVLGALELDVAPRRRDAEALEVRPRRRGRRGKTVRLGLKAVARLLEV